MATPVNSKTISYTLDTHIRKQRLDIDALLGAQQGLAFDLKRISERISYINDELSEGYRNLRELQYELDQEQTQALKEAKDE